MAQSRTRCATVPFELRGRVAASVSATPWGAAARARSPGGAHPFGRMPGPAAAHVMWRPGRPGPGRRRPRGRGGGQLCMRAPGRPVGGLGPDTRAFRSFVTKFVRGADICEEAGLGGPKRSAGRRPPNRHLPKAGAGGAESRPIPNFLLAQSLWDLFEPRDEACALPRKSELPPPPPPGNELDCHHRRV